MAITDHEAVLADLEEYLLTRSSHGQQDLLRKIIELRARNRVPEGLIEKALRLFGVHFSKEPLTTIADRLSADEAPDGDRAMASDGGHR